MLLLLFEREVIAATDFGSVRQRDAPPLDHWRPIPGGRPGHPNPVSRMQFLTSPATVTKYGGIGTFCQPYQAASVLFCHFEVNPGMGIHKTKLGHGAFNRDRLVEVVNRCRIVMRPAQERK